MPTGLHDYGGGMLRNTGTGRLYGLLSSPFKLYGLVKVVKCPRISVISVCFAALISSSSSLATVSTRSNSLLMER